MIGTPSNITLNKEAVRAGELLKSRDVYEDVLNLMHEPKFRHVRCFEKLPYSRSFDEANAAIKEMRTLLKASRVRCFVTDNVWNNQWKAYRNVYDLEYRMDPNFALGYLEVSVGVTELKEEDILSASPAICEAMQKLTPRWVEESKESKNFPLSESQILRWEAERKRREDEKKFQEQAAKRKAEEMEKTQLVSVTPAQPQAQVVQKASERKGILGTIQRLVTRWNGKEKNSD